MSPDRIKATREALGLTQIELAQMLDVHVMTVSKWERGDARPTAMKSLTLARIGEIGAPSISRVIVEYGPFTAFMHSIGFIVDL